MIIEIDQSGRIEETNKPTIVGASNNISVTLKMSSTEKRIFLKTVLQTKPKWVGPKGKALIFAELIVKTVQNDINEDSVLMIDPEYPGYSNEIKNWLLIRLKYRGLSKRSVHFQRVGKSSNAHKIANRTFRGLRKVDHEITAEDFIRDL